MADFWHNAAVRLQRLFGVRRSVPMVSFSESYGEQALPRIAAHEAGHAICEWHIGHSLTCVAVDPQQGGFTMSIGEEGLPADAQLRSDLILAMAGPAGEILVAGTCSGGDAGDIERAIGLIDEMRSCGLVPARPVKARELPLGRLSLRDHFIFDRAVVCSSALEFNVRIAYLDDALDRAFRLIAADRDRFDRLRAALEKERVLDEQAAAAILGEPT